MESKQKKLLIIALAVIGIVATIAIIGAIRTLGKIKIEVVALPEGAAITMDGKPIKSGSLYVDKGTHTFKATHQYFDPATATFDTNTINPDRPKSSTVYLVLKATSAEAKQYLADHPDVQMKMEEVGGIKAEEQSAEIVENHPIVSQLPYETVEYRIDFGFYDNNEKIRFTITTFPVAAEPGSEDYNNQIEEYKRQALEYLESKGINTQTARIEYQVGN